jgi:Fic family protein
LPPQLEWSALVPLIGRANAALARYDELLHGLVNPDILLTPLRTREAVLSSRIEGTWATFEEVMEEEADPGVASSSRRSDVREVLNYREAVRVAIEELERRPISLNLLRRVHQTLLSNVRGGSRAPGEFRRVQNYVGAPGAGVEAATYIPPPPHELIPLLDDLEKYIHFDERDAVVQIGVIHAQFELIHPFLDGNGRVGRILIPLFLFSRGLISRPAFYLSAYLETNRAEYYHRLARISLADDYQSWVEFFLEAVAEQADDDIRRVRAMWALYQRMKVIVVEHTRSHFALAVVETLFTYPVFSTPQFARESGIPAPSAARLLKLLEGAGSVRVLRPGRGRRPTLWAFPELLEIVR